MADQKTTSAVGSSELVMPPAIERWECFRIGHLNNQAADDSMQHASEWRARASKMGNRWQKQVAIAIKHERSARKRYARAQSWIAYGKTLEA